MSAAGTLRQTIREEKVARVIGCPGDDPLVPGAEAEEDGVAVGVWGRCWGAGGRGRGEYTVNGRGTGSHCYGAFDGGGRLEGGDHAREGF